MIPIIVQDFISNKVLMFAWGSLSTVFYSYMVGYSVFFSRSRCRTWIKGETSTNFQIIKNIFYDCDMDCFLFTVVQLNNICCHLGFKTCFSNEFNL